MNRLVATQLLYEADLGKRVVVVSWSQPQSMDAFRRLRDVGEYLGLIHGTNGMSRVDTTRGEIGFLLLQPRQIEGRRFDLAYVGERHGSYVMASNQHGLEALRRGAQRNGAELIVA